MTSKVPPIADADPSIMACAGSQVGPCSGCGRKTHKYGPGGLPLCTYCFGPQQERWGSTVRFKSTRAA